MLCTLEITDWGLRPFEDKKGCYWANFPTLFEFMIHAMSWCWLYPKIRWAQWSGGTTQPSSPNTAQLQNDEWHWAPTVPKWFWSWWICHFVAGLENLAHWFQSSYQHCYTHGWCMVSDFGSTGCSDGLSNHGTPQVFIDIWGNLPNAWIWFDNQVTNHFLFTIYTFLWWAI